MFYHLFLSFSLLPTINHGFHWNGIKNFLKTESTINTLITDEIEVIIQNNKEDDLKIFDSNEIFHNIQANKIDKLFINNKNNEILALDKIPSDHMFHWTKMNPIGFNTLIKTSVDHQVSIYYTDFSSSWFIHSHHFWDCLPAISFIFFGWRLWDEFILHNNNNNKINIFQNKTETEIEKSKKRKTASKNLLFHLKKMLDRFILKIWICKTLLFRL
jgi:hypothetical protein